MEGHEGLLQHYGLGHRDGVCHGAQHAAQIVGGAYRCAISVTAIAALVVVAVSPSVSPSISMTIHGRNARTVLGTTAVVCAWAERSSQRIQAGPCWPAPASVVTIYASGIALLLLVLVSCHLFTSHGIHRWDRGLGHPPT